MQPKQLVYALGGVWLVLFIVSFIMLQVGGAGGDGFARGLNRLSSFLSWQGAAFVVAMVIAWVARRAAERGAEKVGLAGYLPLAVSVFLVGSFVLIVAYRVFVIPVFS